MHSCTQFIAECPTIDPTIDLLTTSSSVGSASMSDWSDDVTFSRCFSESELSAGVTLSFELSTLLLVTSIDTHGTSDVSAMRVEYGLSDVSMITYYDERLETNVRQKED